VGRWIWVGPACWRVRPWLCRQNTVLPGVALKRFLGVETYLAIK
jgi:hypothetical protein